MTSLSGSSFTTSKETVVGTSDNNTFVIYTADYDNFLTHPRELTDGDTLSGGGGIDTLKIIQSYSDKPDYLMLDLTTFATLEGVENIVVEGNEFGYSFIRADQRSLAGVKSIDGGMSHTTLELEGGIVDLRGKTIDRISSVSFTDAAPTIVFDRLETAQAVIALSDSFYGTTVVLEGDVFSPEDRTKLFENGVNLITDASGSYDMSNWEDPAGTLVDEKSIADLDGDHVYGLPGTPIELDANFDAVISSGDLPTSLSVLTYDWENVEALSLSESIGGVSIKTEETFPGGGTDVFVYVGTKKVATLFQDESTPGELRIFFMSQMIVDPDGMRPPVFVPVITADDLKAVINALRYTGSGDIGSQDEIRITLSYEHSFEDWRNETYKVTAHAMPAPTATLTEGADAATGSAGTDDIFAATRNSLTFGDSIDGGDGHDTLWMVESGTLDLRLPAALNSIEAVRGTNGDDTIYVSGDMLANIKTIDGAGQIDGESWDYDRLVITGQIVDLRNTQILNFDRVEIRSPRAKLLFTDATEALAFLGTVEMGDIDVWYPEAVLDTGEISHAERSALFARGFVKITDGADREYTNAAPVLKNLDGDRVTASWNTTVRLDAGANAIVENPEGKVAYLGVYFREYLLRSAGHSVEIDTSGAVKLLDGWKFGSRIQVDGREIGTLALSGDMDGDGVPDGYSDLGFGVIFNDSATAADAQAIIRSLTYRYSGGSTSPQEIEAQIYLSEGGYFGSMVEASVKISVAGTTPPSPPQPPVSYETTTDFTLPADALNVTAGGKGDVKLTGNDLGNSITGNVGKNKINAGAGNDKLNGGLGNDELTGGKGQDKFIFASKLGTSKTDRKVNFDTVKDFSTKDDVFWLDNAVFKKLGKGSEAKPVKLNKKFFSLDKAKDKDDYIVYDKKAGVLSYDADGSGKGQAIEFAQVKKGLNLKYDDFFVI